MTMTPKKKGLLIIIVFILILILPVAYMLVSNFFTKGAAVQQAAQPSQAATR